MLMYLYPCVTTDVFVIQTEHGSKYVPVKISHKVLYVLIYFTSSSQSVSQSFRTS